MCICLGDRHINYHKKNLSKARKYLNLLRELKADRVDVDIPEELAERVRPLDVSVAPPPVSVACQLASGRLAYVIGVQLCSRQRCLIEYCDIAVPWGDDIVLEEVDLRHSTWPLESFAFTSAEFMNQMLQKGLCFRRPGDLVRGLLLASGTSPVPPKYAGGMPFPVTVTFSDLYGETSGAQTRIFLDPAKHHLETGHRAEQNSGTCPQHSTAVSNALTSTRSLPSDAKANEKASCDPSLSQTREVQDLNAHLKDACK